MKGSAVVQGLKAWASRLHPQLPLSQKESYRLLTALTGSFRQHLDEVHPPNATADTTQKSGNGGVSRTSTHAMHSSANLADKHLASVLMNPLLAKGRVKQADQDFANAQVELQKNPAKDPVSLLEEYHKRGAATIPIARLCLEVFQKSLSGLSEEAKRKAIKETEPGRRVLLWLWMSEQYKQAALVDDEKLVGALVSLLVLEGREEIIWQWLSLDQAICEGEHNRQGDKREYYRYRWKGRFLEQLVATKLEPASKSADAAIETYLKACAMKASAPPGSHMHFFPLVLANILLRKAFEKGRQDYHLTDPRRYEQLIEVQALAEDSHGPSRSQAHLWLVHPTAPRAQPMLEILQDLFDERTTRGRCFAAAVRGNESRTSYFSALIYTVALLHQEGRQAEALWLESRGREHFPHLWNPHAHALAKSRSFLDNPRIPPGKRDETEPALDRVPFPTFS
ncbi:hypothetical protein LTR08_008460 [Meristemomyces frigidus]|nr:hypothetical protein LTR08_008460 [Meristemomyces frigidus]